MHGEAIVARARLSSVDIERLEAQRILHAVQFRNSISFASGHNGRNAFHIAQRIDLLLIETDCRYHAHVSQARAVVIFITRKEHVRARHAQAGIKASTQRRDNRNRQKTAP